jgi:hypothetical protein
MDAAGGGRVLRQHAEVVAFGHKLGQGGRSRADLDLNAQRRGARLYHFDRLRMAVAGHEEDIAFALDAALGQRHGFGGGRGFVEHRGVGDRHAGQVADHGLEVDQRFHAALRDLGLVRRVGGVPGGVLQDVAQDHARRVGAVIALADEVLEDLVLGRDGLQLLERGGFRHRGRHGHGRAARDGARHDAFDQRAARSRADHDASMWTSSVSSMPMWRGNEFGGVFKLAQRAWRIASTCRVPCQALQQEVKKRIGRNQAKENQAANAV